jgi:hypothetical protein
MALIGLKITLNKSFAVIYFDKWVKINLIF